jgi:hypothetical protein
MPAAQQETAMSTDAMRARADQLNAAARETNRAAWEDTRRARQLAYEAGLIDAAEAARAEYEGASTRIPPLEAAMTAALAEVRQAQDRLNGDTRRLARRQGDKQKARADHAPAERQEELAVRVHELAEVVDDDRAVLHHKSLLHATAQAMLGTAEAEVAALYEEHVTAARRAEHPGTAPGMPPIAPGVGRISDLDEESRQLIATVALLTRAGRGQAPAPAAPDRAAYMKDQSRFRTAGPGLIVPPRLP